MRSAQPMMALRAPLTDEIWTMAPGVKVQGDTLKTWEIQEEATERVQLSIKSEGRPVHTDVQLWHTPSYVPFKFSVYTEDGALRPVNALIETPKAYHPKTVACYNTGTIDFPFDATVAGTEMSSAYDVLSAEGPGDLVQGGKIAPYTFESDVDSVQILLKTEQRNLKAKIELTQGPNQVKQTVEIYASVGYKVPFYCVIQTPGGNNAIRVINQNTVEFPLNAWVLPYEIGAPKPPVEMGGSF